MRRASDIILSAEIPQIDAAQSGVLGVSPLCPSK